MSNTLNSAHNKQFRNTRLFRTETLAEELGLLLKETQLLAKQVKFEEPDTDKNVVLDDKGSLKRATMLKIVEKLTSESYQYAAAHLKVLFNTYRSYISPYDLMDMFLLRYNSKNQSTKLRVVIAFKTWVEQHSDDFSADMISRFRQLVDSMSKDHYARAPAEAITRILDKPKVVPKPAPIARSQFDFWATKIEELAASLTTIEFDLFSAIKPQEFLKTAWTKEDAAQKAPNITAAIKHFNRLGEFVRTEILFGETPSWRATHIKHFIELAIQLQNQHNWNAFFAIIGALESSPISRLKKTWAEVEKLKYSDIYNKLAALIQPTKNYNKYREKLRATPSPSVPYLGLILNDIYFLDEGNKDNVGDMVNFLKCNMISEQIDQFGNLQNKIPRPFDELCSTLKKYLDEVPTLEQEQDAYEESLKIEPKRNTSSARNSTNSTSASGSYPHQEDDDNVNIELGLQRIVDSPHKKMNFVHEPMTLYLKLLGSHTPTKVVLPSSYTAEQALVNFSKKLTGVTPACSLVELPTNIIPDDALLLPYAKSKSQVPLVIFTDPKIVNVGVTLDKALKQLKEMVLDLAAPLFSMLPILQQIFDLKDPFSFLYVEETRVARWLNMNKTLDEQGFKTDKGLLLLYPLKNMLKENAAYKADADLTGELILRKQDSSTLATLKKGLKTKHYIALHDHFLLVFSSSEALVPKKVLSLEHFRVRFNEKHHEIMLTRTYNGFYHNGKKGSSYVLAVPPSGDDDSDIKKIKQWFDKILINCGLIGAHTIFGVPLSNVSARRGPENPIPLIIEQIIAFLLSMLSKEEEDCSKLFIASGDATLLDFYRQHFDQGLKVEFTKVNDNLVNTVGQLLISYLTELPVPLLTFALYDQFVLFGSKQDDSEQLKKLVMLLPEPNRVVLYCILEFFSRISQRAEELGSVFGPIFLRPPPPPTAPTTPPQTPTSPPTSPPLALSSPNLLPPHDPAVCVAVTRIILSYNSTLSSGKEGILVRRLLVKTRTKTNTLSAGSHIELLPNGTVRSAKSDAVEMASDFQKRRQRTLQNVELQKQKIEEMFKGKGGSSSITLRHSNGYSSTDNNEHEGGSGLRFSASAFYPSRRYSKPDKDNPNNTTTATNNNSSSSTTPSSTSTTPSTTSSTTSSTNPASPRPIYFVKPSLTTALAYSQTIDNTKSEQDKKASQEVKPSLNGSTILTPQVTIPTTPTQATIPTTPTLTSEAKKLHRYGMSQMVCVQCQNPILNYEQLTCSHCGHSL